MKNQLKYKKKSRNEQTQKNKRGGGINDEKHF